MEGKRGLIPVVGGEPPAEVGRGGSPPDKHECSEVLDCDEDLLVDLLAGVALRGPDCTLDFLELAMIFYTGAFSAKSQKGAWLVKVKGKDSTSQHSALQSCIAHVLYT